MRMRVYLDDLSSRGAQRSQGKQLADVLEYGIELLLIEAVQRYQAGPRMAAHAMMPRRLSTSL